MLLISSSLASGAIALTEPTLGCHDIGADGGKEPVIFGDIRFRRSLKSAQKGDARLVPEGKSLPLILVRSLLHLAELLHEDLRGGPGGSGILTSGQQAVADDVNRPIGLLREDGTQF